MPRLTPFIAVAAGIAAAPLLFSAQPPASVAAAARSDASPITFTSLLEEMTDRGAVSRLPDPAYTCRQFSSYDRAAVSPGQESWWANGDAGNFLRTERRNGRNEHVMMDAVGPGAVARIWSANPKGTLRVYLDGDPAPVIEAPMADLLGGKGDVPRPLSAVRSRGYNLYLPIPYAQRCLITSDEEGFYYQINYRTYAAGATVESFRRTDLSDHRTQVEAACSALSDGAAEVTAAPGSLDYWISLKPDSREAAAQIDSPGETGAAGAAVAGLTLQVHDDGGDLDRALREVAIVATFDDEQTIWCPAGDFFGSGVGLNEFTGFYRAVARTTSGGGRLTSRWIMPFKSQAKISLQNLGELPVHMDLLIDTEPHQWTDRSMHFHARFRAEHPIHTRAGAGTTDFNYVTVEGEGVFVGDTLAVMNPIRDWWGEGDEKIYVDGEVFPSHFGTGTEDYYGYAWCCPDTFAAPFHAQPRCDGESYGNNWGHTTVTRTRALDAIPFNKSLKVDMEVWHWKETDVAYAATSYFYARPGATHNRPPAPDAATAGVPAPTPLPPPFKIEGAIEAEQMKVLAQSERAVVGPQGGFAPGTWSGEEHLWVRARAPGDFVELAVPAPDAQPRRILAYLTRSYDYGIVQLSVNGRPVGDPIDTYNTESRWVDTIGPIDLGVHEPKQAADGAGRYALRIEVVGAHEQSEGPKHYFGIDCIVLAPPAAKP